MPVPKVAYQGIKLALNALYNELAFILSKMNDFWFRFFAVGAEGRRLSEYQESQIERMQSAIIGLWVAVKYRFKRVPTDLDRMNIRLSNLTNADDYTFLKTRYSKKAIGQWDRSSIGTEINVLDDIFLKWFDMAWIVLQTDEPVQSYAEFLPDRAKDLISIIKTIDNERRSIRDWFVDVWAWLTARRPASYTKKLIEQIEAASMLHYHSAHYCKALETAIFEWRETLDKAPNIEKVHKWRWLGASWEALIKGMRFRLIQDKHRSESQITSSALYSTGYTAAHDTQLERKGRSCPRSSLPHKSNSKSRVNRLQ